MHIVNIEYRLNKVYPSKSPDTTFQGSNDFSIHERKKAEPSDPAFVHYYFFLLSVSFLLYFKLRLSGLL